MWDLQRQKKLWGQFELLHSYISAGASVRERKERKKAVLANINIMAQKNFKYPLGQKVSIVYFNSTETKLLVLSFHATVKEIFFSQC